MSARHEATFSDSVLGVFAFLGRLAAEVLTVLTSGPVLGFLAALVLLLTIGFVIRLLLARWVWRL